MISKAQCMDPLLWFPLLLLQEQWQLDYGAWTQCEELWGMNPDFSQFWREKNINKSHAAFFILFPCHELSLLQIVRCSCLVFLSISPSYSTLPLRLSEWCIWFFPSLGQLWFSGQLLAVLSCKVAYLASTRVCPFSSIRLCGKGSLWIWGIFGNFQEVLQGHLISMVFNGDINFRYLGGGTGEGDHFEFLFCLFYILSLQLPCRGC